MNKILADILERPIPKDLTVTKVKSLIQNVAKLDENPRLVYSANGEKILKELDQYGAKDIPQNYRGVLLEHWLELLSQTQETITDVPRPTGPEATTLTSDQLENFSKDVERQKQSEKIRADQKIETDRFKKRGEEIYAEQQRALAQKEKQTQELLNQFFKAKVVVIPTEEIPEVKLSKENKETLIAAETAAKEDPATTKRIFEERIQESLKNSAKGYKDIDEAIIEKSVVHLVETLRSLPDHKNIDEIPNTPKALNTLSILNPLTNPNSEEMKRIIPNKAAREKFTREVQTLMIATEAERIVNLAGAKAILGEDLAYSLYGTDTITDFKISSDEKDRDEGVEIDPQAVYEKGRQVYDFVNKVRQAKTTEEVTSTALAYYPTYTYSGATVATKTVSTLTKALPAVGAVYGFRQGTLLAHWERYNTPLLTGGGAVPFLTAGSIQNTVLMSNGLSSKILFTKNFATGYSVQVMQFTKGTNTLYTAGATFGNKAFGVYLGQAGGKVGAGTIAVKATGQVAVKALPAAIASKIGAFLGSAGGLVGVAVGFIGGELIGKLIEKINWPKVKKWFQENGPVLAGVAGLGALALGGPAVGGIVLLGGLAATGTLGTFAAGAFGVLGFIGRSVGIAIATPVIITLLVIPPLVAFIMLVINNSAYVVPPAPPSLSNSTNPYINVIKTAEPAGPFENSNLPLDIKYTITITAKRNALTNITYKDTCKIIQEASNVPCTNSSFNVPTSIAPGSPYVITYTNTYNEFTTDALVVNTFEITATAGEAGEQTTSGAASIRIGDPPNQCFNIVKDGFSADQYSYVLGAISTLQDEYNGYASKICASLEGDSIDIKYGGNDPNYWGYWSEGYIRLYSRGVANEKDTKYILYHELAHVLATFDDSWYDQYLSYPGIRNEPYPYCFYDYSKEGPPPWPFSERFAEAASFYANDYCGNFKQKNPVHYKFMNDVLFK